MKLKYKIFKVVYKKRGFLSFFFFLCNKEKRIKDLLYNCNNNNNNNNTTQKNIHILLIIIKDINHYFSYVLVFALFVLKINNKTRERETSKKNPSIYLNFFLLSFSSSLCY